MLGRTLRRKIRIKTSSWFTLVCHDISDVKGSLSKEEVAQKFHLDEHKVQHTSFVRTATTTTLDFSHETFVGTRKISTHHRLTLGENPLSAKLSVIVRLKLADRPILSHSRTWGLRAARYKQWLRSCKQISGITFLL